MYNIYKDGEKVTQTDSKRYTFSNLSPDREYKVGVSQVVDGAESEVVDVVVKTDKAPVQTVDETYDDLTVADIKEQLDMLGIEYNNSERKKELYEKLVDAK